MEIERLILEIPTDRIRITNKGRLDFPSLKKICHGRNHPEYLYGKSNKCKYCLWFLLNERRFKVKRLVNKSFEFINRNLGFKKCRITVEVKDYNIWITQIDKLTEENYQKLLPDILKTYINNENN